MALSLVGNPVLPPETDRCHRWPCSRGCRSYRPPEIAYACQLVDVLVRCARAPAESLVALTDPNSIPKHIRGRIAAPGVPC